MALRTRIAVTFLLLLAAVLAAALGAVSATNRGNAEREVQRQLDVGASVFSRVAGKQSPPADPGGAGGRRRLRLPRSGRHPRYRHIWFPCWRTAATRIGAAMVVLTSLNGEVIASLRI